MTEQLKPLPCPFCGGTDIRAHVYGGGEPDAFMQCHDCSADGPNGLNRAGAIEAWNRRAQPAQAGQVLTRDDIIDAWLTIMHIVNATRRQEAFARAIEAAVLAKRVPMQQISDGEFAPDAKLLELADKIDHEQNWRHSGIFQRDHLTQDQKDRVLAGVMLRRYADLMAPESWRLFPPKSVVSHSYRAATLEAVVKMAERHGIVGEKGGA